MTMMRKTSWSMLRVRLIRGIANRFRLFMKGYDWDAEIKWSKYANVIFGKLYDGRVSWTSKF